MLTFVVGMMVGAALTALILGFVAVSADDRDREEQAAEEARLVRESTEEFRRWYMGDGP